MSTYRVVAIRERHGKEVSRTVLFPGPLTLEEAHTCIGKTTCYSWRRLLIEPIIPCMCGEIDPPRPIAGDGLERCIFCGCH